MSKKFRIGILECDHFDDELRATYGTYGQMFQNLLLSVDPELTFITYKTLFDQYPQDLNACNAYLITGSKYSIYEKHIWIKKLQNFVYTLHQHQKQLIGICFGHQIIARVLGGEVKKAPQGWGVGTYSSSISITKPWMDPPLSEYRVIVSHQDQVMTLPENAEQLSSNEFCENSAFQIGNHILCFQGHPEFSDEYARARMQTRKDIIGRKILKEGLSSLELKTDEKIIAQWIINFLTPSFKNKTIRQD